MVTTCSNMPFFCDPNLLIIWKGFTGLFGSNSEVISHLLCWKCQFLFQSGYKIVCYKKYGQSCRTHYYFLNNLKKKYILWYHSERTNLLSEFWVQNLRMCKVISAYGKYVKYSAVVKVENWFLIDFYLP